jgi:hemolysin activation/secretion protein
MVNATPRGSKTISGAETEQPSTQFLPTQSPKSFRLGQFEVQGSTVLKKDITEILRENFEGKDPSSKKVQTEIKQALNKMYIQNGYLTSRVSKLDFQNGVLTIQIVEGEGKIIIENESDLWLRPSFIQDRIGLGSLTPLNTNELEGQLRLLASDPLLENLEASLRPTGEKGKTDVHLRVKEARSLSLKGVTDNYSPPSIGSYRFGVGLGLRNLTGFGEQWDGSYYRTTTSGGKVLDGALTVPVNALNGTLELRGARYRTKFTQSDIEDLDIEGKNKLFSIRWRQPVIRTFTNEAALSLGFMYQKGRTFIFQNIGTPFGIGPDENGVSRTSVIQFGQEYIRRLARSVWVIQSQLNFGTGLFNATNNSEPIPDGKFFSWLGQIQLAQRIANDHLWVTQGGLQLTPDGLLAQQQFVIGGVYSVRGYRQNARIGDQGFRFSTEDRIAIFRDGVGKPWLQIIPFVDMGKTWNVSDNPNPQGNQRFLIGVGLGLQLEPTIDPLRDFTIRVDYAPPIIDLDDKGTGPQNNGFYFSVSYQPDTGPYLDMSQNVMDYISELLIDDGPAEEPGEAGR